MSTERIETLERLAMQLADTAVAQAATTATQGVVVRVLVEVLARDAGASAADVRDFAADMAVGMGGEIAIAVHALLAEPPAGTGVLQ